MILSLSRNLLPASHSFMWLCIRHINKGFPVEESKQAADQVEYIKAASKNKIEDWPIFKNKVLNMEGSLNQKNFNAVLLKLLTKEKEYDAALSFAHYLKSIDDLNLGSINGLFALYYEMGSENKLTSEDRRAILELSNNLYDKYHILDSVTCERLLHALCVIDEWKKALKVLEDIKLSSKPSHSAYSTLVATLFRANNKSEAMKMIEKSVGDNRPLQHMAYIEWINYILQKYKDVKEKLRHLDEICLYISKNNAVVTEKTAEKLKCTYLSLGWKADFTKIRKENGQCICCKQNLDKLELSDEEFILLQRNVKDKLIVGSDLFLKTSPEELRRFLDFVEDTAPYDVVIDALNVAYVVAKGFGGDRVRILANVIEHFTKEKKKIFLLGRKHMFKWPRIRQLLGDTCYFFTDNISQDDPFFITAAILSGPHTNILTRDLLRGHRFNLQNDHLKSIFQRWQWQHQYMIFSSHREAVIQPPLPVTPCAQKNKSSWHLPYDTEDFSMEGQMKDGTPDWNSWLCIRPPANAT